MILLCDVSIKGKESGFRFSIQDMDAVTNHSGTGPVVTVARTGKI